MDATLLNIQNPYKMCEEVKDNVSHNDKPGGKGMMLAMLLEMWSIGSE